MVHGLETLAKLNGELSTATEQPVDMSQLTDAQFYIECNKVFQHMLRTVGDVTNNMCELCQDPKFEAGPMLEFGMRSCLESLGNLINNMDICQPEDEEISTPVFEELRRRFS